jgi:uncharacterized protein
MNRDIFPKLVAWKNSANRKPLLLKGARQTGKTYLLKQFGNEQYANLFYYNFEKAPEIKEFFVKNLDPVRIIEALSLYSQRAINPATDLIIFDEIQACNGALTSLKYFQEEHPEYHVAAAGSLLGIKLSVPGSFPVGKVNLLELHPMTFFEFLDAVNETRFRKLIHEKESIEPFETPFHDELIRLLKLYYFIGGMPEAVQEYANSKDLQQVGKIHEEILSTYELDFSKHAPTPDIPKLSLIWRSIPQHLSHENKKFVFSAIRPSAKARDYSAALQWLDDAGLINRAFAISHVELPLDSFVSRDIFKVYTLDVGLLAAMARIDSAILAQGAELFQTYHGAFVENYVAQQIKSGSEIRDLIYWKSEGQKAEIDFLRQIGGKVFPLEVKAGVNPRSKSLQSYREQYSPSLLVRSTLLNLKLDGKILNIPLYAINSLERYMRLAC